MTALRFRAATFDDARLLWQWANDPDVRKSAFSSEPIEWESHCRWLQNKLNCKDCRLWILECDDEPVGQIRCDRTGERVEVDYSVGMRFRGRGLGSKMLELGAQRACSELGVATVVGVVKADNQGSVRAFERAGFCRAGTVMRSSQVCIQYERACVSMELPNR